MLRDGYSAARRAIYDAIRAHEAIEFNGRDYYPQGPEAVRQSRAEHGSRFDRLNSVMTELQEIELHIQDRIDEKAAQMAR